MNYLQKFLKGLKAIYDNSTLNTKTWKYEVNADVKAMTVDQLITKANEANSTGQDGFGADFVVPEQLLSNVIARVSATDSILDYIPAENQFNDLSSSTVSIPVRGWAIRMRWAAENANVPWTGLSTTKVNTAKVTLSTGELWATVYVSYSLLEDSVVNFQEYVESELAYAFDISMHQFIINGDDEDTDENINYDGTQVDVGADYIQNPNGLRKLAIAGNKTVNVWSLDLVDIRTARKLLWLKGAKPDQLALVMNSNVYFELLNLGEVKTKEVFGDAATVVNGVLEAIDGIKIMVREEVPALAKADGKVSATGSENTTWTIILVHLPSMFVWFKRLFLVEGEQDTQNRQIKLSASTRPAFNLNQNDAPAVAVLRNITLS